MKNIPKAYEPRKYEDEIYQRWEVSGFFNPDVCIEKGVTAKEADSFCIVLPPPNVTGNLHIGHAVMLAIQDVMIRYHRMKGDKTLWLPGTDHAAIATQTKVEKMLMAEEGMKDPRRELGREAFLKRVEQFAAESRNIIINQAKKMGASLDWSREAYTLDAARNRAVNTIFKMMYDDGLIYRGDRIVNWCPRCKSTLADDEVEYREEKTKFYYFKYGPVVIGTARPETKFGDKVIVVHPDDARYKDWVGKEMEVEWIQGKITAKMVADEVAEMEMGTGAMTITPAHSFVDFDLAKKYGFEITKIIDEAGNLTPATGSFAGKNARAVREEIVEVLRTKGLVDHIDENYIHNLSVCYRCGTVIEPLPKLQWFVNVNAKFKMKDSKINGVKTGQEITLKKLMRQVVKNGQIKIIPERFEKIYFNWIDNLRDWCISRQIWFGHRIPVWYRGEEIYVGGEKPNSEGWQQDPDTLDTWFSSGLWTFSTLGWPDKTEDLNVYHPTSVLETGYDILPCWVARMILMTTYAVGEIPFEKVYLHGLVCDEQGRKMSKSLGNVINPLDTIQKYGADATRLSLLVGNTSGNVMRLSEAKVAGFRNFANKLWNIARFMLMNIEQPAQEVKLTNDDAKTLTDVWILDRLEKICREIEAGLAKFNFSYVGEQLREFTWTELADWYLEVAKIEGGKSKILNYLLNTVLKLWHPFMPFVTEVIWQEVYGKEGLLMVKKWPETYDLEWSNRQTMPEDFNLIKGIITGIRSLRADNRIEPQKKLNILISAAGKKKILEENFNIIKNLSGLGNLIIEDKVDKPSGYVGFITGGVEVFIDLTGVVDLEKEKMRLENELIETEKYLIDLENKLANPDFVNRAPSVIIKEKKTKLAEIKEKREKLNSQIAYLS